MILLTTSSGEPIVHLLEVGEHVFWKWDNERKMSGTVKKKPLGRGFYVETDTHIWHLERIDSGAWKVTIGYRIEGNTKY